jgi:hypothetical protein
MPYEPIMRWETEGGAVLRADEDTDRAGAHVDRPEPEPSGMDGRTEPAVVSAEPPRD